MKGLLISFLVGVGVGVIYGLLRVKSPAPPIIALIGLLGIVLGEQIGVWALETKINVAPRRRVVGPQASVRNELATRDGPEQTSHHAARLRWRAATVTRSWQASRYWR